MGIFSGRDNSADRANEQMEDFLRQAINRGDTDFGLAQENIGGQNDQLREDFLRQRGQTEAGFDPFIQAGEQGLDFLRQGSTAEGFNKFLEDITGGNVFQSLRDEQVKTAQGQAAAGGQTLTGETLRQLSQISPQLALQLESQLFGRNRDLANQGFQGVDRRAAFGNQLTLGQGELTNNNLSLEENLRNSVSGRAQGFLTDIGGNRASTIRESDRLKRERDTAVGRFVGGTVGSIGGAILGGPKGAKAGGQTGSQIGGMF